MSATAASHASISFFACGRNRLPAAVSSTILLVRRNNCADSDSSSLRTRLDSALLRQEERAGGAAEVPLLGDGQERAYLRQVEIHGTTRPAACP